MPEIAFVKNKGYYSLEFSTDSDVVCAFSCRQLQNMSLFYGDTINALDSRKNFLGSLGIDCQSLVCAKQTHSSLVRYVKEQDRGRGSFSYPESLPDTDGLITDKRNVALAVFTADCLSIFLYDPKTPAIGLVHAGWRNTKDNILGEAIRSMEEGFNTRPESLYVGFGPAIRSCCYAVGSDFDNFFPGELIKKNGRYWLDLVKINKKQILDLGIEQKNIFDSNICTSCSNHEFFSYRREDKACGRMVSVVMLR